jgi:hypothetical protein
MANAAVLTTNLPERTTNYLHVSDIQRFSGLKRLVATKRASSYEWRDLRKLPSPFQVLYNFESSDAASLPMLQLFQYDLRTAADLIAVRCGLPLLSEGRSVRN